MVLLKIKGLVFYIGMVICRHVQKINQNTVGLLICKNTCRKGLFNSGLILQQAFLGHKKLPHPYFFFSFCVYNATKRSCNRIAHKKREKKRRYRVKTCGLNTSIKVTTLYQNREFDDISWKEHILQTRRYSTSCRAPSPYKGLIGECWV